MRERERKIIALIHSFLWSPPLHTLTNTPIPTRVSTTPICSHFFSLSDYSDSCISMWACAFVCAFSPSLKFPIHVFCVTAIQNKLLVQSWQAQGNHLSSGFSLTSPKVFMSKVHCIFCLLHPNPYASSSAPVFSRLSKARLGLMWVHSSLSSS